MKKVIYRFQAYSMDFSPRFLIRKDNNLDLMGWNRFLDLLFDSIKTNTDIFEDFELITKDYEEIFVDMDRLRNKNWQLYLKTNHFLNEFDDFKITPDKACEWLDELEDFVCAKVVSIK